MAIATACEFHFLCGFFDGGEDVQGGIRDEDVLEDAGGFVVEVVGRHVSGFKVVAGGGFLIR